MQLFKLKTRLHQFDNFADFAKEFNIGEKDLIVTNEFIYEPFMKALNLKARVLFQEKYGVGEPSDEMMNKMLEEANKQEFDRVIAVGGGTVVDISKLFILKGVKDVKEAFQRKIEFIKEKELIIIPTTCGTGSEVTNLSIAEIKSLGTKMGLAVDELLADDAVLIPEFIKTLPYKFYVYSSIDALIHAAESFVSPKSNPYTELYSIQAIKMIMGIYTQIIEKGEEYRLECLSEMLIASNYAGIAFGNTGVGAVHALSYPLGGKYHVPHGEANYQFFTEIFKRYAQKNPEGRIKRLNKILAECMGTSEETVYQDLENLLGNLLAKNKLQTYGMKNEDIDAFTEIVITGQQRLLANNYVELSIEDIKEIYKALY